MKRSCWCKKWQKNVKILENAFTYRLVEGGDGFEHIAFQYCPWCGTALGRTKSDMPPVTNPIVSALDEMLLDDRE